MSLYGVSTFWGTDHWLGWRDLNPRMTDSESVALPLGYTPRDLPIIGRIC